MFALEGSPAFGASCDSGSAVRLRRVVCALDGRPVLAGVDLDVGRGESVLVSGENGAGKSTLLRVIAGLVPFRSGQGAVLGHDLTTARAQARAVVALVGHQSLCYDDLSVRANVRFHAAAVGRGAAEAERWLDRVGLRGVASRPHGRLSAGQRRRCALALALLRDAPVLLLDEPYAALDTAGRTLVDELVAEAHVRGAAVVMVSHEREHAREVTDREVLLDGGLVTRL